MTIPTLGGFGESNGFGLKLSPLFVRVLKYLHSLDNPISNLGSYNLYFFYFIFIVVSRDTQILGLPMSSIESITFDIKYEFICKNLLKS